MSGATFDDRERLGGVGVGDADALVGLEDEEVLVAGDGEMCPCGEGAGDDKRLRGRSTTSLTSDARHLP